MKPSEHQQYKDRQLRAENEDRICKACGAEIDPNYISSKIEEIDEESIWEVKIITCPICGYKKEYKRKKI